MAPLCKALSSTTRAVVKRVVQTLACLCCNMVAGSVVYTPVFIERLHSLDQIPRLASLAASKSNIKAGISVEVLKVLRRLAWRAVGVIETAAVRAAGTSAASTAGAASVLKTLRVKKLVKDGVLVRGIIIRLIPCRGVPAGAARNSTAGLLQADECPPPAAAAAEAGLQSITPSLLQLLRGGRNIALAPSALLVMVSATVSFRGFYDEQYLLDVGLLRMVLGEGGGDSDVLTAVMSCLEGKNGEKEAGVLCMWLRTITVALKSRLDRIASAADPDIPIDIARQSPAPGVLQQRQPESWMSSSLQQTQDALGQVQAVLPRVSKLCLSRLRMLEDHTSIAAILTGLRKLAAWQVDGAVKVWAYDVDMMDTMAASGLLRRLAELQTHGATQSLSPALSRVIGVMLRTVVASGAVCAVEAVQVGEGACPQGPA